MTTPSSSRLLKNSGLSGLEQQLKQPRRALNRSRVSAGVLAHRWICNRGIKANSVNDLVDAVIVVVLEMAMSSDEPAKKRRQPSRRRSQLHVASVETMARNGEQQDSSLLSTPLELAGDWGTPSEAVILVLSRNPGRIVLWHPVLLRSTTANNTRRSPHRRFSRNMASRR